MSVRGRIGCYLCGRYRLYGRWRTVSDRRHGREQVGRRLLTTIASHGGIMPPPMSASNFGRTCPPGGHAPSAARRGWPSRQGAGADWTRAAKCLSGAQQRRQGLLRCPMSRPHRLWDTGQTTLWLLTGAPRRRIWSPGGAQGNPCIEGDQKARPGQRLTYRLRRDCRMASKAAQGLAYRSGRSPGLAQEQEPGVRGDGRRGRGD